MVQGMSICQLVVRSINEMLCTVHVNHGGNARAPELMRKQKCLAQPDGLQRMAARKICNAHRSNGRFVNI